MVPVTQEITFPGIMHQVLVWMNVVLTFLLLPYMGLGLSRYRGWKSFKLFSFICLPILIIAAVVSGVIASKGIEVIGLTARIVAYTFYIWLFILAYQLIRKNRETI